MKNKNLFLLSFVFLILGAFIIIIYNFSYKKGFNDGKKYNIEKYIIKYEIDTLKITKIIKSKQNKKDTLNNNPIINVSDTSNINIFEDYYYGYDSLNYYNDSISFNIYYDVKFFPLLKKFFIDLLITDLNIKFKYDNLKEINDLSNKNILFNNVTLFFESGIDNNLNYYNGIMLSNNLNNLKLALFPYFNYDLINKKINGLNFSFYLLNNILNKNNINSNLGFGFNNKLNSILYFDIIYNLKLIKPGFNIELIKDYDWKTKYSLNIRINLKN